MTDRSYKPSARSRVRAFFFTDRVGQTLAASLGFVSIARWWTRSRFKRLRRGTR